MLIKWNLALCDNMEERRGRYASDRERQIPSDVTDVWNKDSKSVDTENWLGVTKAGGGAFVKWVKGMKRNKLPVIK